MIFLIYFLVFIFGLSVGSFLNCVIYRLETNESFLKGRSFCPYCKHILSWQDLIPLFSFLILKGKCRYCQQKISWQYPLVEFFTAILFSLNWQTAVSQLSELPESVIYYWIISSFLIIIFVFDLKHYIIPDKVIYPAIAIAFLYCLFGTLEFRIWDLSRLCRGSSMKSGFQISNFEFRIFQPLLNPLLSAILASTFFLLIVLVSRGKWLGLGDVKLAFLLGLFLGWPNILVSLFLSFLLGAIIGIALIISGKKTLKSEVPFGPFLVTGTFVAMFWGKAIINWYLNLFL